MLPTQDPEQFQDPMSTQQQHPAKMVRLRQSCDNCYNKKIKCSRGQPCDQCLTHGKECNYSPSARSGKPPKAATRSPGAFPTQGPEASMFTAGNIGDHGVNHFSGRTQNFTGQNGHISFWNQPYGQQRPGTTPLSSHSQMQNVPTLDLTQYLQQGHSRSNSCDSNIPLSMSNTSPWQQTQDMRQMEDLNQTPLSTPTNIGMDSFCLLAREAQETSPAMGNHTVNLAMVNHEGFAQRHLPTPPPNNGMAPMSFLPEMTNPAVTVQQTWPASVDLSKCRCTCFKDCSEFNNCLHDTYTRLKESSGDLDPSSFNTIMELIHQATAGCFSLLSCQRCTGPIQRESAITLSNIISQISRLYQQVVFWYELPRDIVSRPFASLLAVREEFAKQCHYLAEDPQSGLDLVGIVTRSMEWFDHTHASGGPLPSIDDDFNSSENGSDMSFQY